MRLAYAPWFLAAATALASTGCVEPLPDQTVSGEKPVVYGDDDRADVYEYPDPLWAARVAEFTVALVPSGDINASNPNNVQFPVPNLQGAFGVCADERFATQLTAADCSGTLIAPDLVLTAGHCVTSQAACLGTRFVFDYYMTGAGTLHPVTANDIYECEELVVRFVQGTGADYAIVRLTQPALGRTPALVSTATTALASGTPLYVHGFPSGLPLKIDNGGAVRDGRPATRDFFVANVDTFGGNSGSGVFDQTTGRLVGILVRGETDYVFDPASNCDRVNRCPENGCNGEEITYAFRAFDAYCAAGEPAPFCLCGDSTCDPVIGESTSTCPGDCGTQCGDGACNGSESPLDCAADCGSCGNSVCDAGETSSTCCTDCGCSGNLMCQNNLCMPDPGAGDTCAAAIVIPATGTQTIFGDTRSATNNTTPSCASGTAPDRFYTFTLTQDTSIDARVSGYDTTLSLQTACGNSSSEVACNDDATPPGNYGSRIAGTFPAGTYFLVVDGYNSTSLGPYTLDITFGQATGPGPGDSCANPTDIPATGTQVLSGNTSQASPDFAGACGGDGAADQVYRFTLTTTTSVTAEMTGFDTVLHARSSCGNASTELACNDDNDPPGNFGSRIELPNLPPGTYFLIADGFDSNSGPYTLTVTFGVCDSDGDGVCVPEDQCPNDPDKIDPGQCGCGVPDTDTDSDGAADCIDLCPQDPNRDEPGACGCGSPDADGDGTGDCADQCPNDPAKIEPGICGCGTADTDTDRDGLADCQDGCPSDPAKTEPGICGCGVVDSDANRDGDSAIDCQDGCPDDAAKDDPGICGCGAVDTDGDGDGTADCNDLCLEDASKADPGQCGCGVADTDGDSDGTADCNDLCPEDAGKADPGMCGCGEREGTCGEEPPGDGDGDGCGCSVGRRERAHGPGVFLLFGLMLAFVRHLRRR